MSVRPYVSDDFVMHAVFKGGALEFIGLGGTKNWIVLFESLQDWFEVVIMYYTWMPSFNGMNKVRWEIIKLCAIFG